MSIRMLHHSKIASTIVLLAVVAMGYNALAFVRVTPSSSNDAATLAQPERGAEANFGPAALEATLPGFDESRLGGAGWTEPRECDLGAGLRDACVFMD